MKASSDAGSLSEGDPYKRQSEIYEYELKEKRRASHDEDIGLYDPA